MKRVTRFHFMAIANRFPTEILSWQGCFTSIRTQMTHFNARSAYEPLLFWIVQILSWAQHIWALVQHFLSFFANAICTVKLWRPRVHMQVIFGNSKSQQFEMIILNKSLEFEKISNNLKGFESFSSKKCIFCYSIEIR